MVTAAALTVRRAGAHAREDYPSATTRIGSSITWSGDGDQVIRRAARGPLRARPRGRIEGGGMRVFLLVKRRSSPGGLEPEFARYEVEVEPHERVLDVLVRVSRRDDPTLAFRRSCGHGVCGSDAMVINGRERLACKTLIRDVADKDGDVVILEPLRNLPVRKDLVVDQEKFFIAYRSVKPYLVAPEAEAGKERPQTFRERAAFENATNCILCGACYSACLVLR
jgi:succinate dehydrogenase / fumarate reductase iron-sulfur subunit